MGCMWVHAAAPGALVLVMGRWHGKGNDNTTIPAFLFLSHLSTSHTALPSPCSHLLCRGGLRPLVLCTGRLNQSHRLELKNKWGQVSKRSGQFSRKARQNLSVWDTRSLPVVFQVVNTVNRRATGDSTNICIVCWARWQNVLHVLSRRKLFQGFRCKWERSPPVLICICSRWTGFPSQVHTLHLQCWNDSAKAISFFYSIHINLF